MHERGVCLTCRYILTDPVPTGDPFQLVGCHQCGVTLGCTRQCYVGDAMYSDGTFGGGDVSTCAEANAPCTLMSVTTGPRHRETLVGYPVPRLRGRGDEELGGGAGSRLQARHRAAADVGRAGHMTAVLGGEMQEKLTTGVLD